MRQLNLALAACSMLLLASCSNPRADKVKAFAADFASIVNSGSPDSLIAAYPDAALADSLHLEYIPDSVSINDAGSPNTYEINYGKGVSIVVEIPEDGSSVTVKSSSGLFSYPPEKISFARKVGAIDGTPDDKILAERMTSVDSLSTDLFNDYVASRKNAIRNLGATITKEIEFAVDLGKGYYTLKNTTDQPIAGDEYKISWSSQSMGPGYMQSNSRLEDGKDIAAGGTVRIPFEFTGHYEESISGIIMKTPSKENFFRQYEPTGKEYAEYMAKHGVE